MKLTFWILIFFALMIWTAEPNITFKPFKLTFSNGYYAFGLFMILIGIGLVKYQGEKDGKQKGIELTIKTINETLAEKTEKPED